MMLTFVVKVDLDWYATGASTLILELTDGTKLVQAVRVNEGCPGLYRTGLVKYPTIVERRMASDLVTIADIVVVP